MQSKATFLAAFCVAATVALVSCNNTALNTGPEDMTAAPPDLTGVEGCGLVTCQSANAGCGPIGDGCGNSVDCGSCPFPQTCGGGGTPFQCGGTGACAPLTCAGLSLSCGMTGDGCGGTINCYPSGASSCPNAGDTCGGGGVNGVCGTPPTGTNNGCVPRTCAGLGYGCGTTSDGCGGTLNCDPAGGCPTGQTCGGAGVQFQCGMKPAACVPTATSCPAGLNCGSIGDGCGGTINCSMATPACPGAETCGGGGMANVCGPPACTPKTTANCGTSCGFINDGCGGTVDCSTKNPCTAPATCGGGGMTNVCGMPMCVPKTCAMLGANCGWAGDGCGNLICCGTLTGGVCSTTCPAGQLCGSVQPNQCGNNKSGSGTCMTGVNTTISGKVVAPTDSAAGFGNPDPIYNATVFVPSGAIQAITTGATCDQCSTSQPALASTTTAIDGTFTLINPPTGSNITLVIQLGKWRRVLTLATVTPCVDNPLTTAQTRLPRKQAEFSTYDNIPRFAISSGDVDVMECVMRKMGIADSEFVNGNTGAGVPATGRVQIYQANYMTTRGNGGAVIDANTPSESNLWGNATTLDAYDAILFPCTGGRTDKTTAAQQNLVDYANKGGRVFATHFSYVWLYNNTQLGSVTPKATASWKSTATWAADTGSYTGPNNGLIDLGFPKGINLSQWLANTVPPAAVVLNAAMTAAQTTANVASTAGYPSAGTLIIGQEQMIYSSLSSTQFKGLTRGVNGTTAATHATNATVTLWAQIPVNVIRNDFKTPLSNAQRWMYVQNNAPGNGPANFPIHYTFNTPVGLPAANQCGRAVFSDFHVENSGGSSGVVFPKECNAAAPLTPQEKLLEFMLFDLTSCVAPDVPTCTPLTCNNVGAMPYTCGQWGDGCGGTLNCGACTAPQTCGGGGMAGQCGAPKCVPKTCASLGNVCGSYSDGCSGTLNCTCMAGSNCIASTGQCVAPCTSLTCNQLGYSCGKWSDGCGGIATCMNCTAPQTCGGGGTPGQCGGCTPLTCSQLSLMCGDSGDGCGGTLHCGTCTSPATCGGGGTPGVCGSGGSICTPLTCQQQGLACGSAGDGCGNVIQCGPCPTGQTCGGGGVSGQCGSTGCTPYTCQTAPGTPECGIVGDGCGGTVDCGACQSGQLCGGSGVANHCGAIG